MQTQKLRSGREMPMVGLGLWKIDQDQVADVVVDAIDAGYRHFDSACDYGNEVEAGVGLQRAMAAGTVTREALWVTSKLWNTYHRPEHVRPALMRTLSDLKLDYLDLYHMHFPIAQKFVPFETRYPPEWIFDPDGTPPRIEVDSVPLRDTWHAMEELQREGLVRELGVCNFGTSLLRDLMNSAETAPAVHQIELHPYLCQEKLLRFCREAGIAVTGFSSLGAQSYFQLGMAEADESVIEQEVVKTIAARHERTAAQVVMRWAIQRGTSIVPKSVRPQRLRENIALFDFALDEEEMAAISGLDRHRRFNDPGEFAEAAFNTFFPIYD